MHMPIKLTLAGYATCLLTTVVFYVQMEFVQNMCSQYLVHLELSTSNSWSLTWRSCGKHISFIDKEKQGGTS